MAAAYDPADARVPLTVDDGSRGVGEELLRYLAHQGARIPVPVLTTTLLVALMADSAPLALTAGWMALVCAVLVVRFFVLREMQRNARLPLQARLDIVSAMAAVSGIVHGLSFLFWPHLSDLQRVVQTLVVMGMCAANVVFNMGYPRSFIAYMVPALLPTAAGWVLALAPAGVPWYASGDALIVAALFASVAVMLPLMARDTWRLFRESFESRQRLRAALDAAETANRAKTRFLASASHDLRQPMHTVSLFAAALTMRPLDAASREIAGHIDTALRALSSQLDALLDISKLDAGIVAARKSEFAVEPLLRRLVAEFEPAAARKGLRLALFAPDDASIDSDPLLLERILRNLVDNAIKYTQSGSILLSFDRVGGAGVLRVRDTGPGIPTSEHTRVFEEFYQLGNPERDRSQGLGLGLSIVKRLCELLALEVTLRSTLGEGTTFELRMPCVAEASRPPASAAAERPDVQGLSALVVDDEEAVRQAMQTVLEGLGCRCRSVAGLQPALDASRAERPDIVLADLRLRGDADGIAVVQAVRALHPGVPALLISGDTAPARLRDAHEAGLRLLHKPVPVEVLTRSIREEVDGRRRESDAGGRAAP